MENKPSSTETNSKPSYIEFLNGGGCKVQTTAFIDHLTEAKENNKEDNSSKEIELMSKLYECMEAHSDYYQPYLTVLKSSNERVIKELEANLMAKVEDWDQAESDDEKGELIHKFMEGGDCKESWMACMNCFEEVEKNEKRHEDCDHLVAEMMSCADAHSDYYPSWTEAYMAAEKTVKEQNLKEVQDIFYFPK